MGLRLRRLRRLPDFLRLGNVSTRTEAIFIRILQKKTPATIKRLGSPALCTDFHSIHSDLIRPGLCIPVHQNGTNSTDVLPLSFLALKHRTPQLGWGWCEAGNQAVSASGGLWGCDAPTASRHRAEYIPTGILERICQVGS